MFNFLRRFRRLRCRCRDSSDLSRQLLERADVNNQLLAQLCVLLEEVRDANTRSDRQANSRLWIAVLFSLLLGAPSALAALASPEFKPVREAFSTIFEVFSKVFGVFLEN